MNNVLRNCQDCQRNVCGWSLNLFIIVTKFAGSLIMLVMLEAYCML